MRAYSELPLAFVGAPAVGRVRGVRRRIRRSAGPPRFGASIGVDRGACPPARARIACSRCHAARRVRLRIPPPGSAAGDCRRLLRCARSPSSTLPSRRSSRRVIGYAVIGRTVFWRDPAFCLDAHGVRRCSSSTSSGSSRSTSGRRGGSCRSSCPARCCWWPPRRWPGVRGRWRLVRVLRVPIGVVFLGLLAVNYARASRPVVEHVEYAGLIPRLEQLARRIGRWTTC